MTLFLACLAVNSGWNIVVKDKKLIHLIVAKLNDIMTSRPVAGIAIVLAAMLILSACATQRVVHVGEPPPLLGGSDLQVVDVDVLEVSPAMEKFLRRYIMRYQDRHTRATLLMSAVSGNGVLGFKYDDTLTLTAAEAFEARAGNCVGFANMFVALARRAGLRARYQEILRQPEWSSRDETVLLIKHINVILELPGYVYVMDVSGIDINPVARRHIIEDSYAKALYWNNIGAEALLKNDLPTAHAYISKAIETESALTDSWVNLGVVLGRNDQLDDAAFALRQALEIDPSESAALSNLYEVYLTQEDLSSAAQIEKEVEKYRQKNPYYLLYLSEEALMESRFEESKEFLQRAIRKKKNDHLLHFAMAKTQYLSGETEAAENSLLRARELAPQSMLAYYGRPLDELVAEAIAEALAEEESE